ncbi:hypothetical protein CBA19CS11_32105 [Caballeronia novacaledonica]|uniref:hypothetical protein n=1 Tax=Caballeronia novacaledonica TaxID=1544861 RepID=UPI001EE217D6|nr:hypothetical protein [Caballeronia novacaledonica]GJH13581.1 hypothetical protein CBA19CS11_32105 [Caballeronia novacaledonica]
MAQGFQGGDEENGERARRGPHGADRYRDHDSNHDDSHRWPIDAPSVAVARVVLKVDGSITLKRAAATAWLTAHHHAAPALPIKPTRMELAVIIALAEPFGAALYKDARFVPVLDFIAEVGAVALVQRVMYGARIEHDDSASGIAHENTRLANVLRDARVAFEFLCATWPEVYLAQTHAVLAGIGVRVRPLDADPMSPSVSEGEAGDDEDDADDPDEGEEGGHG